MPSKLDPIPYGKHHIDQDDIDSVVDVLLNRFLTQGDRVPAFENALCEYTKAKFSTAVNSATSGLHVACLALGVGPGDIVWTVPNSFVASANCALYCGASVDFVDIDPVTRNMSVDLLAEKLTNAAQKGVLPKAIIPVHFSGLSCQMDQISALAKQYEVKIIEDAAHGLGGRFKDTKIGSCEYCDIAVLSFHPVKSMTTAEGGAVMTNSPKLDAKIKLFAKHGITKDPAQMKSEVHGPWYYQQIELGYNYRLSDLQAALGLSQLNKLDEFIAKRRNLAARYQQFLSDLPLTLPTIDANCKSAWHLYMLELQGHDRKEIYDAMVMRGIGVNVHYIPIHLQPYFQNLGFSTGDFPNSEKFYKNALTIPLFPSMTADDQDRVIQALNEVLA
ncbi:UDP-4-amino-4,6-dideoxy-N-acetyl-beta-L-altrosamine transaminase [Aliiglaciecola sp. M165]|uniref:UDP-4-amino-4, 6-dideoxy-N-acetyl-beta-L-altrosamine transaminase n=1 Tax=Aliiglaciecola sp. M165 TaxID=2593649 RepID=UPI00117D6229|nr:UDP-4-amino-4,6-dideoxy-N-acetyl-beta-L-altrosamine transaminase [Aliiglaciecola sp. M165]TRY30929.1 UDP-4-amino-4,6-dideoxy-N-acetyl-beta-L-altrosamine transaminase [Aliiglaciecola sp. M165]